ncbi:MULTISPECIES: DUF1674 domain-containing protein [Methylobacterium]|uniref:DUF1674 domain-containing protein n=1 Tax=Methylobacterium jeotgali TaxID=381630 RepID=A0ABQ4SWX6_9HYPH|nr:MULTISPECIES: DUF1674 domain-containing protein [Methylobacterium]PIU05234.1 MAG: DUF1674 domain-containing protein [Methylobacterium sp. CG09_land_8_20_14_0_10_71_15]PIU15485.1 MAG: DUF1674 domain-containing protein [Methylobacterium sp. CG08_land_8_20_14_0_20_71_15]GBU16790.1 hypothetical protein AwMethylo_10050 [Methylobacterium sp.]GJE06309.1 hypothetical protein AOPFMNJM_1625 [Methylobacterium jeotgali]
MQDPATHVPSAPATGQDDSAPPRPLSPAAQRALAEAAERRAAIDARAAAIVAGGERLGRGGLEPVRYEDWEVKGLAVDF